MKHYEWMNKWINKWSFIPHRLVWTHRKGATLKLNNAYNAIYSGSTLDILAYYGSKAICHSGSTLDVLAYY